MGELQRNRRTQTLGIAALSPTYRAEPQGCARTGGGPGFPKIHAAFVQGSGDARIGTGLLMDDRKLAREFEMVARAAEGLYCRHRHP
jgi:hypothetical protein